MSSNYSKKKKIKFKAQVLNYKCVTMSIQKCRLVYGTKKYTTRLKSSDWQQNYQTVISVCSKKTQKEYGKEVHIEIDGAPIISKEQFAAVMQSKSGESEVNVTIKVKELIVVVVKYEKQNFNCSQMITKYTPNMNIGRSHP